MSDVHERRVDRLRGLLRLHGVTSSVSFAQVDCRYLTGFTGEAGAVVVGATECVLLTDPRFTVQAEEQARGARVVVFSEGRDELLPSILTDVARDGEPNTVAVDPEHMTVKRWDALRSSLEEAGVEWRLVPGLVAECRRTKFGDELEAIRRAGALVTKAFARLESIPVVGRTEREIALELEMFLRGLGSEGVAFPLIVAAGPRSAMPHAEPSDAVIAPGQLVVLDLGAVVDGYVSDITRTYATGPLPDDLAAAYERVREAQSAAVSAARKGALCADVDAVARGHLTEAGLAGLFVHSLGHGVGLEVHEDPTLSSRSTTALEAGMAVTIEPGVYLEGRGGIRIEDTIIIGEDGPEIVTVWPRGLRTLM